MKRPVALSSILLVFAFFALAPVRAQEREGKVSIVSSAEQEVVISAFKTAISIIQDITRRHAGEPISQQLQSLSGRMSTATSRYGGFRSDDAEVSIDLSSLLSDIRRELRSVARDLDRRGEGELANTLLDLIDELSRAVRMANELERESTPIRNDWRSEELARDHQRIRINPRFDSSSDSEDRFQAPWRRADIDWHRQSSAFVGEYAHRWPFGESAQYRPIPALRYNRVEGLVLGVRRLPLEWGDYDRGRIYGQAGYAFSLEDWRYEVGIETKLSHSYRHSDFDLKIGSF